MGREAPAGLTASDVALLVEMGLFVSGADYLQAERFRRTLCRRVAQVFGEVEVIVVPTAPLTAWRTGETEVTLAGRAESALAASWRFTYPWNLAGAPAVSVPCGFDRQGLPIGLQIASAPFDDLTALRVAGVEAQIGGPTPKAPVGLR